MASLKSMALKEQLILEGKLADFAAMGSGYFRVVLHVLVQRLLVDERTAAHPAVECLAVSATLACHGSDEEQLGRKSCL